MRLRRVLFEAVERPPPSMPTVCSAGQSFLYYRLPSICPAAPHHPCSAAGQLGTMPVRVHVFLMFFTVSICVFVSFPKAMRT
ncbi:hypothetical protein Y032_0011g1434 [Ancylostoma ceylanicum]|uniref:Uncharacterized protein n=1 Tax=Ancylostoma ceylanicum TaxID=53326 RepID=A0A016VDX7_9BILA|nr:hypothetical protein Y032_0011g1434 [Ancylostoma ceylanicum]